MVTGSLAGRVSRSGGGGGGGGGNKLNGLMTESAGDAGIMSAALREESYITIVLFR
jgi:hypothetical protein